MIGDIRKFRFWCQKVLPLVYDDSLSYYEVLCKIVQYLNKVIEDVNSIPEYIDAVIDEKLSDEHLQELIEQFVLNIEGAISSNNEGNNTNSSADYNVGQMLWWNGKLYRVIRQIDAGDTFIVNTNIALVNFEDLFNEFIDEVKHDISANDDGTSATATQSWAAGTWLWLNDILYIVKNDITEGNAYVFSGDNANVEQITVEEMVTANKIAIENEVEARSEAIADEAEARTEAIAAEAEARTEAIGAVNEAIASEAEARENADGDLSNLTTEDKSNLVAAINEVNSTGGGAIAKIGDLNDLTTTDKSNVVAAINEVNGALANLSDYRIINVLDYGATGDGVTDDTNAVNLAITALNDASDVRKALYFPSGSYLVGDLTTLSSQCVVFGAGANASRIIPKADTTRIFEITQHFTEIKNLLFDDTNTTTALCIYAELGNGVSIHDIKLENIYKFIVCGNTLGSSHDSYYAEIYSIYGSLRHEFMRCNGCKSFVDVHDISVNSEISYNTSAIVIEPVGTYIDTVKLSNVSIQRYYNAVFMGTSSTYNQLISNVWINNCIFDGIGGRGIFINVPSGTTADIRSVFISDTWIAMTGNAYNCITLQNASDAASLADILINNCKLIAPRTDTNSSCIDATKVKDLLVEGCELVEYNRCGITLSSSEKITINDNEIGYSSFAPSIGNTYYGVILTNNTKMLVTGNNLINNHTAGISESGNSNYRIENNLGGADTGDNYAVGEVKYRNGGFKYWNGSAWT